MMEKMIMKKIMEKTRTLWMVSTLTILLVLVCGTIASADSPAIGGKSAWLIGDSFDFGDFVNSSVYYYSEVNYRDDRVQYYYINADTKTSYLKNYSWNSDPQYLYHIFWISSSPDPNTGGYSLYIRPDDYQDVNPKTPVGIKLVSGNGSKSSPYKFDLIYPEEKIVTYKIVNGTWSDGSTIEKRETVTSGGSPSSVPTNMKAKSGYTGGAWDKNPQNATITADATFTYSFSAKDLSVDSTSSTGNDKSTDVETNNGEVETAVGETQPAEEKITISKKPAVKKLKAAKGRITVSWNKFKTKGKKNKAIWKKIKNIEVQCSTKKNFPADETKKRTIGKTKKSVKFTSLKKKTTYFVRVRYCDGAGGCSKWSAIKKVKTK